MPAVVSLARKLLLAALSLIIFIGVIEGIIRLFEIDTYFQSRFFVMNRDLDYPDVFKRDRHLFWRPYPSRTIKSKFFDGRTYSFNSLGLRGREIEKTKFKPRIIALGNSCTFGWGLNDEQVFTTLIGNILDKKYDVINAAVPGYSSYQGKAFYESKIAELQPDVLLILFAWNDQWVAANDISDKNQEFPPEFIIDAQNLLSRLHTYRLMKKLLLSVSEKDPDSLYSRIHPVHRVSLEDFYNNLKSISLKAQNNGATPVLLTSPIPSLEKYYIPGSISPLHTIHEQYNMTIRELAKNENVPMVDLALEFDKYNGLFDDADYDPIHFNARGHRLAAELIARKIASLPD